MRSIDDVKRVNVYVTLIICLISIILLLLYVKESKTEFSILVESTYQHYEVETKILEEVLNISSHLGYGGMIHGFKNYLIRGEDKYYHLTANAIASIENAIVSLSSSIYTEEDKLAVQRLTETVSEYKKQLLIIKSLSPNEVSLQELDNKVKVDDSVAFDSIALLRANSIGRTKAYRSDVKDKLNTLETFISYGVFLIMPLILLSYIIFSASKAINKTLVQLVSSKQLFSVLLESYPDPSIISNDEGSIVEANKSSEVFFGYSRDELLKKKIEDLIPKRFRKNHLKYRESYNQRGLHEKQRTRMELLAINNKNEEIDIEISLKTAAFENSNYTISTLRDIRERKKAEQKIITQANFDGLTGLPNRNLSLDRLLKSVQKAKRSKKQVAVMLLDLDDFKKVNDTFGHEYGDYVLQEFSKRANNLIRVGDTVGRLGGDEFVIILGDIEHFQDIALIAKKFISSFQRAFTIKGRDFYLGVSIGISIYPIDMKKISDLIKNADTAMYKSKEHGKNRYTFFTPEMNRVILRRFEIEEQLLKNDSIQDFSVVFQPKIDMVNNTVIGVETLLRWNNESFGNITPDEFIPIAESTGAIHKLGDFVLKESAKLVVELKKLGFNDFCVAVNLSPVQFRKKGFIDNIKKLLQEGCISPDDIELEITEGVLVEGTKESLSILQELSSLGLRLAMDDFGKGYSSLSYLRELPFNIVKIDKAFISGMNESSSDKDLVKATISMTHALSMKVVAEGVETTEQEQLLVGMGCDIAQGYLFSKPLEKQNLIEYLSNFYTV